MDSEEEEDEIITMEDGTNIRRVGFSDYFIVNPGRPPRRILNVEEALEFSNEIGEALRRERRNSNIINCAFLFVLILVIMMFLFIVLLFERTIVF